MSECLSPWYAGLTCDHVYADCPNRMRGEKELRRWGWWDLGDNGDQFDIHGTDVCGMCVYRHNRSEHKPTAEPEHQPEEEPMTESSERAAAEVRS